MHLSYQWLHVLHLLLVAKQFWAHSLYQLNHCWYEHWWCSLYCTGGQWEWPRLLLGHWAAGRTHHLPQDDRSHEWCWNSHELGLNYSTAMLPWHLRYLWPGQWAQWEWEELRWYKAQSKQALAKLQAELQEEHGVVNMNCWTQSAIALWNIRWVISTIFCHLSCIPVVYVTYHKFKGCLLIWSWEASPF